MSSTDKEYYRARADQEREAAQRSGHQHIAEIHLELAAAYEALANEPDLGPNLRLATG